jgi:hypothetical protein
MDVIFGGSRSPPDPLHRTDLISKISCALMNSSSIARMRSTAMKHELTRSLKRLGVLLLGIFLVTAAAGVSDAAVKQTTKPAKRTAKTVKKTTPNRTTPSITATTRQPIAVSTSPALATSTTLPSQIGTATSTSPKIEETRADPAVRDAQDFLRVSKVSTIRMFRSMTRIGIGGYGENALMVVCDGSSTEIDASRFIQIVFKPSIPPPFVEILGAIAPGYIFQRNLSPNMYVGVDDSTKKNQWLLIYFGRFFPTTNKFDAYEWAPDFGGIAAFCNGAGGLPGDPDPKRSIAIPDLVRVLEYDNLDTLVNRAQPGALTGHAEVGLGALITEDRVFLSGVAFCADGKRTPLSTDPDVTPFPFRGFYPSFAMFTSDLNKRAQMETAIRAACP